MYGNQVYISSGQVISGLDIHGKVTIKGSNITLKNSIVRDPAATTSCVNGTALRVSGTANIVRDVEVAVAHPTARVDAVYANNATLSRLNVHGGVDGLKLYGNVRLGVVLGARNELVRQ